MESPPGNEQAATGTGPAGSASPSLPPPVQLTFGGSSNGVTHGLADFVAQEEMDRYRGFWWSLDSCSIAFTEVGRCFKTFPGLLTWLGLAWPGLAWQRLLIFVRICPQSSIAVMFFVVALFLSNSKTEKNKLKEWIARCSVFFLFVLLDR